MRTISHSSRSSRRPVISRAVVLYVIVAALILGGIYAWDVATREGPVANPGDPAVRARAAAQSITGEPTVRRVILEEPGIVTVEARSKYYNANSSVAENRQYLATEGRLIIQLILHDMPEMVVARVALFNGRTRLAVIEGRANQKYDDYHVTYEGRLAQ